MRVNWLFDNPEISVCSATYAIGMGQFGLIWTDTFPVPIGKENWNKLLIWLSKENVCSICVSVIVDVISMGVLKKNPELLVRLILKSVVEIDFAKEWQKKR